MDDGPLLFSLMGQCFQGISLTKWTSVIAKQCPNEADCTKSNFNECIYDYLEAVAGFPNIGNQLICWLCMAKKPAFMPMHEFMRHQVQLLSYLEGGYLRQMMDVPTAQEKSEQVFFAQPKVHQNKFADLNKMVPTNPLKMIALSSVKQPTKRLVFLRRLSRTRSSQRKGKWLIFLLRVAVNQATINIAVTNTAITIEATNAIATIADLTIIIKTINAMIVDNATTRIQRETSPMTRRMITSTITPRKRATRPCIMTSPLCQAPAICPKEGVDLIQDLLCALVLGLDLAQAAGARTIIMSTKMIASQVQPSSAGICTPRTTMTNIIIARTKTIPFFPPSPLQMQRKSAPRSRESHQ
jgi:hypothetical protein